MTPEEKKQVEAGIRYLMTMDYERQVRSLKESLDAEKPGLAEFLIEAMQEALANIRGKQSIPEGAMKAMLSQPMAGKTSEEIIATREKAVAALTEKGYFVVNTLFTDEWYRRENMAARGVVQIPVCFIAKSLESMSMCHAVYFCKGWENARGCRIEHEVAKVYGMTIIYEEQGGRIMNEKDFVRLCKKTVAAYANEHLDKTDGKQIAEEDVYIVWMCKTLQNSKAMASTTLFDGMYYELTYNGNTKELYVDAYKKWENFTVVV